MKIVGYGNPFPGTGPTPRTIKVEVMQHTTMELEAVHVIQINHEYPVTIEFENKILSLQLINEEK